MYIYIYILIHTHIFCQLAWTLKEHKSWNTRSGLSEDIKKAIVRNPIDHIDFLN